MAGRTPRAALDAFLEPLRQAVCCVTDIPLTLSPGSYNRPGERRAVLLGTGDPVRLDSPHNTFLSVSNQFCVVETSGERGPWKVKTLAYLYALENDQEKEILAYHWHPDGGSARQYPHLRIGIGAGLGKSLLVGLHVPTGRVALEQVLRFAIEELEVVPKRDNWAETLATTQGAFEQWRTWG